MQDEVNQKDSEQNEVVDSDQYNYSNRSEKV